jgi:predicted amidohydrolase YtcJ
MSTRMSNGPSITRDGGDVRTMGVDKEVGTIEAGKRADVAILGANPLESIRNLRTVEFVVTNGVMYNCAELWRSVGFKP